MTPKMYTYATGAAIIIPIVLLIWAINMKIFEECRTHGFSTYYCIMQGI